MSESGVSTQSPQNSSTPDAKPVEHPPNYKRLTDDDLYRHSSQFRLWSFTPDKLLQKRTETNARAVVVIEEKLRAFKEKHKDELTPDVAKVIDSKATPITTEEELKLVNFYAQKVQVIAQKMSLPTEVVATSISFFRRFFLENSVLEVEPKDIVHTTIFLACKSENYFISVNSFAEKAKATKETILKYEFKLLETLKFTLMNHHPYKPLHGFFLDIQKTLHGKIDLKYMGKIYEKCKKRITEALLTDAVYFYTPPQITLATLMIEDEALTTRYLELKFHGQDAQTTDDTTDKSHSIHHINFERLLSVVQSCKEILEKPITISVQEAKGIMAKIYYCENPEGLLNRLKREPPKDSEDSPAKKQKVLPPQ
ncbi:Cyclin, N-terminal domain [Nakaseomyces glabratus]|nr:Cyclin, N-terminal domain [Nakaseomyces glabratus]KAJ9572595.1 hypothetical protein LTX96_0000792 [Nakaseomyces glabratus]